MTVLFGGNDCPIRLWTCQFLLACSFLSFNTVQFESYTSYETFQSKKVRVISKPSKKRQSIRYNELRFDLHLDLEWPQINYWPSVLNRAAVWLFLTEFGPKHLVTYPVDQMDSKLRFKNGQAGFQILWLENKLTILITLEVLHLYLLDTELEYAVGGFVNYGNIVQFADQTSGFSLPPCRIHRCEQSGKWIHSRFKQNDSIRPETISYKVFYIIWLWINNSNQSYKTIIYHCISVVHNFNLTTTK